MIFILFLLIVSSFIFKGISSAPVLRTLGRDLDIRTNRCEKDVQQFCQVDSSPTTIKYLYDIRACLRENRGFITKQCLVSLGLDKPSLVESCYPEMKAYCSNIGVDMIRIHSCLSGVLDEELSADCQEELDVSRERAQKARDPPVQFSWIRFIVQLSQPLSSEKNGDSPRGITFIEIRDDKGSIFLSDDDDNQDHFSDVDSDKDYDDDVYDFDDDK